MPAGPLTPRRLTSTGDGGAPTSWPSGGGERGELALPPHAGSYSDGACLESANYPNANGQKYAYLPALDSVTG